MILEDLMKRREAIFEQHRQALATVEQTRGALFVLDEIIAAERASANGATEASNDMETVGSTERNLSS
jgi:hypothetical protein